jgi:hypothetical protein
MMTVSLESGTQPKLSTPSLKAWCSLKNG